MTPMRDVVEQLQRLGMSGYEAKAYVTLAVAGQPLNGYEVAKRSGVPRSTVYETLGKLVARGAAYELRGAEEATGYLALPPRALLERMRREFDDSIGALQSSLPTIAAPPGSYLIHNLKGADALLTRAEDVVASARTDLFLSIWPEEMRLLFPLVGRAAERGVEVSMVHFGPVPTPAPAGHVYEYRFPAPETVAGSLGCRLLVVAGDTSEVLIGGFAGGAAWGVYTEDPAVVLMAVEYVRNDITLQVVADRVGHEALCEIWNGDPDLVRLRARHGHPAALLRTMETPTP